MKIEGKWSFKRKTLLYSTTTFSLIKKPYIWLSSWNFKTWTIKWIFQLSFISHLGSSLEYLSNVNLNSVASNQHEVPKVVPYPQWKGGCLQQSIIDYANKGSRADPVLLHQLFRMPQVSIFWGCKKG